METRNVSIARRVTTVIGIIICLLVLPVLVMNVTIIVRSYLSPDVVPSFMGVKPFIVLTGSMEPEIMAGDLIVARTIEPSLLKVGDVISFKEGSTVVTHRIAEITDVDGSPAFITMGDANNTEDASPVTFSQVEGVYAFRIAGLGSLAMFMQTPVGLLLFIAVPLAAFIVYDMIRRRQTEKKSGDDDEAVREELEQLRAQLADRQRVEYEALAQ